MFSASRSRRCSIVAIIQSFAQLTKNYGREGEEIIVDNTQLTVFGGFAPNSESAERLSKSLGTRTVQSGSISRGKNDPSQSLQMIERALMTPDELKSLPKGTFVVTKTGAYPMQVKINLIRRLNLFVSIVWHSPPLHAELNSSFLRGDLTAQFAFNRKFGMQSKLTVYSIFDDPAGIFHDTGDYRNRQV